MTQDPNTLRSLQGAVRLTDWGVIRASGEDARSFLQGQLTQDVLTLEDHQARLAGLCTAKGRLVASFVVWCTSPTELYLACSADLLAATLKRLSMFVLRAKCKLSDASDELAVWGLAGEAAAALLGVPLEHAVWSRKGLGGASMIRLPDAMADGQAVPRLLWIAAADTMAPALQALQPAAWRWLEVMSGTARIMAATSEQFVPQMVNLELVDGVSFQKGCYPGQEIVARSQYRGTLKRRAFVVTAESVLQPGQEVFHSGDDSQPCGMVVLAGQLDAQTAALVELKLAAVGSGRLHAGTPDGPSMTLGALPYDIPTGAA